MKKLMLLLYSFLLVFVVRKNLDMANSFFYVFVFSISLYFIILYLQKYKFKTKKLIIFESLLFAIFLQIGIIYQIHGSITFIYSSIRNFLETIISVSLFTYLIYFFIPFLNIKLDNIKDRKLKSKVLNFIDVHPFLSTFLVVFSVSVIYIIFFYPGSMSWDGLWQLDFYYGVTEFKDHHPALLTLFMGLLMDIGRWLHNDNLGMFLYIFLQVIINALVYSYTILIMKKINTPFVIRFISLIFYAFMPLLAINSITYIKDTIFYLFFLLFFVYLIYHFYINSEDKKSNFIILGVLGVLLYLTRNTGFYIVLITFLVLFLVNLKRKKVALYYGLLCLFMLGVNFSYHEIFLKKLNILEAPVREKLSIPLQQTGRYLKYYPKDLSKEEKETLENVFMTSLKEIGELYDPNRSDNVKFQFLIYPTDEELNDYFKVWFSMMRKHPIVYIDATLNNVYGYFYPNVINFIGEEIGFYDIEVDGWVNQDTFHFKRNNLEWGRNALKGISQTLVKTPVFSLLYTPSFYVWIFIFLVFGLIPKRRWDLLCYFVPILMVIVCALVSPVNAHMRYVQPILVSTPFLIALFNIMDRKKISVLVN